MPPRLSDYQSGWLASGTEKQPNEAVIVCEKTRCVRSPLPYLMLATSSHRRMCPASVQLIGALPTAD